MGRTLKESCRGDNYDATSAELNILPRHYGYGEHLCWDCENACGGCSWTEVDPVTGKVRFKPVEGWKTRIVKVNTGRHIVEKEQIYDCPLFIPTKSKGVTHEKTFTGSE